MLENMESQKAKLKEKMSKRIDEYFEAYEKGSSAERFTINDIEKLMMENQRKIKKIMTDTTTEIAESISVPCKKNARSVEEE